MSDKSFERQVVEHAGAAAIGAAIGLFAHKREQKRLQQAYEMLVYVEAWGEAFPHVICDNCGSENVVVGLGDVCFSCGRLIVH